MDDLTARMTMLAILVGLTSYFQVQGKGLRKWLKDYPDDARRGWVRGVLGWLSVCDAGLIVCGIVLIWQISHTLESGLVLAIAVILSAASLLHAPLWWAGLKAILGGPKANC